MGSKIGSALKGLMEDTKYRMNMEGAPLGGKRVGEALGTRSRHKTMVGMETIDTKTIIYFYQLLWSCS
jgi:hypothetical protein